MVMDGITNDLNDILQVNNSLTEFQSELTNIKDDLTTESTISSGQTVIEQNSDYSSNVEKQFLLFFDYEKYLSDNNGTSSSFCANTEPNSVSSSNPNSVSNSHSVSNSNSVSNLKSVSNLNYVSNPNSVSNLNSVTNESNSTNSAAIENAGGFNMDENILQLSQLTSNNNEMIEWYNLYKILNAIFQKFSNFTDNERKYVKYFLNININDQYFYINKYLSLIENYLIGNALNFESILSKFKALPINELIQKIYGLISFRLPEFNLKVNGFFNDSQLLNLYIIQKFSKFNDNERKYVKIFLKIDIDEQIRKLSLINKSNTTMKIRVIECNFLNEIKQPFIYDDKFLEKDGSAKIDVYNNDSVKINAETNENSLFEILYFKEEYIIIKKKKKGKSEIVIKFFHKDENEMAVEKILDISQLKKFTRYCTKLKNQLMNDDMLKKLLGDDMIGMNKYIINIVLGYNIFKEIEEKIKEKQLEDREILKNFKEVLLNYLSKVYHNKYKNNEMPKKFPTFENFVDYIRNDVKEEIKVLSKNEKQEILILEYSLKYFAKNIGDIAEKDNKKKKEKIKKFSISFTNYIKDMLKKKKIPEEHTALIWKIYRNENVKEKKENIEVIKVINKYLKCISEYKGDTLDNVLSKVKAKTIEENNEKETKKRISECLEHFWVNIDIGNKKIDNVADKEFLFKNMNDLNFLFTNMHVVKESMRKFLLKFQIGNTTDNIIVIFIKPRENNNKRKYNDREANENKRRKNTTDERSSDKIRY